MNCCVLVMWKGVVYKVFCWFVMLGMCNDNYVLVVMVNLACSWQGPGRDYGKNFCTQKHMMSLHGHRLIKGVIRILPGVFAPGCR